MSRRNGGHIPGGWRGTEIWLDPADVQWFGELKRTMRATASPQALVAGSGSIAVPLPGAVDLRFPRDTVRPGGPRPGTSRQRRIATRLLPVVGCLAATGVGACVLLALGAADSPVALPAPAVPVAGAANELAKQGDARAEVPASLTRAAPATVGPLHAPQAEGLASGASPAIRWRRSAALGLPHAGTLVGGVRLPQEGPNWTTWDPARDRAPNRVNRLYGTDALVRVTLGVIASYRLAHPDAPKVVIGDLSRRGGGEIDEHASHENGLDVDVYYPRRDGLLRPPTSVGQVDRTLAQDLVDRFVAAGAQVIFVGRAVDLRGPDGVVVPYQGHDDHLHVRIPAP